MSYARPPMLYRGNYVQWSSRFMNVIMGYKERKLLINSIKNGPYVMKEIPDTANEGKTRLQTEDDLSPTELAQFEADIRAKNLILYGLSNDIYNAIDSNLTAHDLWKALERLMQGADVGTQTQQTLALWNYQSFKQLPEESLEDAYIRFNKLINEMNRHNLKRSNIEHNTMFLTNLQPEWRRFTIAIRQNQDLTAKDINNLFDLLKHNQVEVNDILDQKRKKWKRNSQLNLPHNHMLLILLLLCQIIIKTNPPSAPTMNLTSLQWKKQLSPIKILPMLNSIRLFKTLHFLENKSKGPSTNVQQTTISEPPLHQLL